MESLQKSLDDKKGQIRDLREQVDVLDKQNAEYKNSINEKFVRFRESIDERGKFEYERNNAVAETEKLQKALIASKEEVEALKAKVAQLEAVVRDRADIATSGGDKEKKTSTGSLESELEQARAEIAKQKKKTESVENSLEYTRKAYQDASKAASDLGLQNQDLQSRVGDLTTAADESFRRVHEINAQTRIKELERVLDERDLMLRDREATLDRVSKELAALRNGRRETRQASVPRSPRMGMMSPRPGVGGGRSGIGGSASRGTSPAPPLDPAGLQAGLQYNGNRWVHLRDHY
jgi:predicted  nucleic acid-binding Zn-ribbon protein